MFTHRIAKTDKLVKITFSKYATRHYLKDFEKKYHGRQWQVTLESIVADISRIRINDNSLQETQQVDELWYSANCWIFKYDFAVAKTNKSSKNSGNRCIVFLDSAKNFAEILIIYSKDNLPKNIGEQAFVEKIIKKEFGTLWRLVTVH